MIINDAILHILDNTTGVSVISKGSMDFEQDEIREYMVKHLERAIADPGRREGIFHERSTFFKDIKLVAKKEKNFLEFSQEVAETFKDKLATVGDSMDLLMIQFREKEVEYVGILFWKNKLAFTHFVNNEEEKVSNEIIRHYAVLPSATQRVDAYALINMNNYSIFFSDKKREINGEEVLLLPDLIMNCDYKISGRASVKAVNNIIIDVAEEFGVDTVQAVSRAKELIVKNAEVSKVLKPAEIAGKVFDHNYSMTQSFDEKASEIQLPVDVKVDQKYARKAGATHKIRTDTGIEIIFPTEYNGNDEYLNFITGADGKISIEIKNITEIMNK